MARTVAGPDSASPDKASPDKASPDKASPDKASTTDGRAARSQRTRDAVVEALLDLIEAGDPRPTARRVAERAGVSLRSVYVHFDDLEDLFIAAAGRQLERTLQLAAPISSGTPLSGRIEEFTSQRCHVLERVAPVRRAAVLQEPFSPALARVLDLARKGARDQVELVFAPELDRRGTTERRRLLHALDVAASTATWETLRRHTGLSVDAAHEVVVLMLTTLLEEGN
jgi:TetR/AcrR family transcriptional regulator, regulator of autoinduction and epiphytic fitness